MRLFLAVVLALASTAAGCCFFEKKEPPPLRHEADRPPEGTSGGELVYLDVALIQRPPGDRFLDREVWETGDEQEVDLETKPVLEENGLRVGQLGGMLPARLQALLSSPVSCPDPRRLRAEDPSKPLVVPVGPVRVECSFEVRSGGKRPVKLKDACCQFEVLPVLEEEQIRLRFTPQVQHGKARLQPHVAREPDGELRWAVDARPALEEFPALRFELSVAAGEYVLLGTRFVQKDTLGHSFFVPGGENPGQWLLVLRASRVRAGPAAAETSSLAPPLALQAGWTTARGSRP